ncbi:purine/pyrimidine permease [Paenibacillus sp. GCM10027626]|uniref:purine/pyrimidine permease n=1 Tax=Paenibacillus sp. GCM10027626 TaxID=3273411 RepID=UPI00362DFBF0
MRQILPSLQWLIFILSGSIVVPVTLAASFGLEGEAAMAFISRTFLVLAVSGLLQTFFGHRLPINEGPAGLWWGFFSLYAGLGLALFGSAEETLRVLEFALLVSGVITIILSLTGLIDKLTMLFTPFVVGIYMILLVAQLSGAFVRGLLGIDRTGEVSLPIVGLSFVTISLSFLMTRSRRWNTVSILLSIAVGWALFALCGYGELPQLPDTLFIVPELFALGMPRMEWSVVPTTIFVTLLLITNMLATIKVVQGVMSRLGAAEEAQEQSPRKAGFFMGISQLLGGMLSAVGSVPISGAAGFIAANKVTSRVPFIIASLAIIVLSFFAPAIAWIAALPPAVGYAAVFPIFSGMMMLGLREWFAAASAEQIIARVGMPLFAGIGVMAIPAGSFSSLPPLFSSLLSNGLILGTIIALIMEAVRLYREKASKLTGGAGMR